MTQFVTEPELRQIQSLIRFLNSSDYFTVGEGLAVDCHLTDSNGEHIGSIGIHDGGEYGFLLTDPPEDPNQPAVSSGSGGSAETSPVLSGAHIRAVIEGALTYDPPKRLVLTYIDHQGTMTIRAISPARIEMKRYGSQAFEQPYLVATDLEKGEPRSFRLDRIKDISEATL